MQHLFNVFGRMIAIDRKEGRWSCCLMGADGKRRPMELVVPQEVTADELVQYLYDPAQLRLTTIRPAENCS